MPDRSLESDSSAVLVEQIADANILLYQPAINTVQGGLAPGSSLKTVYDVGLIYAPTKNSFLELRFQNAPYYQSYQSQSPFHLRMR